jgi:hypothetical protein
MVLAKLGELDPGETVSSEDAATVYEAIDLRLKEIHRLGIYWPNVTTRPLSFTLTANIASASASVDILFPISMHVVNGSVDEPVAIIGIREYADIHNKTQSGIPEKALYISSAEFIFWPVPTATTTAKLVYEAYAEDTAASTAPDIQVSMMRWLKDIIAYDLADEFGKPEAMVQRLEREAMRAELNIRKLAVQRVDYTTVRMDDHSYPHVRETDYEWYR